MAAQVLLLLLALVSNTQAEVILRAKGSHRFHLDSKADFCSVTSWTREGTELLWNTSGSYYWLPELKFSHSGRYREQCWTQGRVTLQRDSTFLVCDDQKMKAQIWYLDIGQTMELTCDGVGPNQSLHWAYESYRPNGLALIVDETPSKAGHQVMKNKSSLLLTVDKRSVTYYCLEKQPHRCDLHTQFNVYVPPEFILRTVGESLELQCSEGSADQMHVWGVYNALRSERESLNSTLRFPSLTVAHTGLYICGLSVSGREYYHLNVCPESEPPTVALFTVGENLTLRCGDWNQTEGVRWFMRSGRTKGRVSLLHQYQRPDNMFPSNRSLVIADVSLQDSGEFWCVVERGPRCVFRSETRVRLRGPVVDHYLVRTALLSVVIVLVLCAAVAARVVEWSSRRSEQLPSPVEEIEMSQLSPESDVQEETAV